MADASQKPGLRAPRAAGLRRGVDLPRVRFLAEVAARGYEHVVHDEFPGAVEARAVRRLGAPVIVRASADGGQLEAFLRLDGGLVALLDAGWGQVEVEVAGRTHTRAAKAVKRLRARLARPEAPRDAVRLAFWSRGTSGGAVRWRDVDVPSWKDIRHNYAPATAARLDRLMRLEGPRDGRLLLWHGIPGSGKTFALRALAAAWRSWCTPHYVLDPDFLLGGDPRYLLDLLTWDDDESDCWRLLVLEDAGELVCSHARDSVLASLLNLTDGVLGQGTRTLVVITTNEPLRRVHPAITRPGRCLCELEFAAFAEDEARAWLARAGRDADVKGALSLSQLFALSSDRGDDAPQPSVRPSFGFGRALR